MRKSASFYFFMREAVVQKNTCELWRGVASFPSFKAEETLTVECTVFYYHESSLSDIVHKSDADRVKLNLRNENHVSEALGEIINNAKI